MNEEALSKEIIEDIVRDNNVQDIKNELGEFSEGSNVSREQEGNGQPKMFTEKEANELAERISKQRESRAWKKAQREKERELQEYNELFDALKAGMKTEDIGELKCLLKDFYTEQGVNIPQSSKLSDRQEKILAKAEAEEIIELGDDEINRVANEIYNKPLQERTMAEKIIFEILGNHVIEQRAKQSLIDNGIDVSILDDKKFKEFASKFNVNTDLSDIYNMYNKVNVHKERPKSTGSAKSISMTNEIKEFYTPDEVEKFSMKDLDNPQLMRAVESSMSRWR